MFFPIFLMTLGLVFMGWSIPEFIVAANHRGWQKYRGTVQSDARQREQVQVLLDTGHVVTAVNGSNRRLRPGRVVRVLLDPQNAASGRTLPAAVGPLAGGFIRLFAGLLLVSIGFGVRILMAAVLG